MGAAPLVVLGVVVVLTFLVHGLFIWVGAKAARLTDITYRWSLLIVVVLTLIGIPFAIGAAKAPGIPAYLIATAVSLIFMFVALQRVLRASFGKTLLVAVIANVMNLGWMPIVLVVMPLFVSAYVVPTGGMADGIIGYHKAVTCPQCGYLATVNASREADTASFSPPVSGCACPNCRYEIDFVRDKLFPAIRGGDRILVAKAGYGRLNRYQVVAFAYPVEPQFQYIKRLIGLPGETIAICQGQLYVHDQPRNLPPRQDYWARSKFDQYNWGDDPEAKQLWEAGKFNILRRPLDTMLNMSHNVFDTEFTPLGARNSPLRWSGEGWQPSVPVPLTFTLAEAAPVRRWLSYRHILGADRKPELITDFVGYNSGDHAFGGENWAGDLILEAEVLVMSAGPNGELAMELCRGADRFQARFSLASGECTLYRNDKPLAGDSTKPTLVKGQGTYRIRLANVDERLTLWVNDTLPFGDGVEYNAATTAGPTESDLAPAGIAATDATLIVGHMKLSRDTYYLSRVPGDLGLAEDARSDPARWTELRTPVPRFMAVYPGHYLCLGDNSAASADGRVWGLIPEARMVGPAVLRYYPFARAGWVR